MTGASVTPGPGQAEFEWTAPNSYNYFACRIFVGSINDINAATLVATEYGPPSAVDLRAVTGLSAGTHYAWLRSMNASGVMGAATATGSFIVT